MVSGLKRPRPFSGSARCNPGGATQETTAVTQQPVATFGRNYDTAYDWWSTDSGLTNTDNVFTIDLVDDNTKADWSTGPGLGQTFGLPNPT